MDTPERSYRVQRTASLTDEVWIEAQRQAVLENKSVSDLCEYVLADYLHADPQYVYRMPWAQAPQGDRPEVYRAALRSFYIHKAIWAEVRALKARQHRSIAEILEQQLRLYLNLDLGDLAGQAGEV